MEPTTTTAQLVIASPAFSNNDFIPQEFTCDGDNTSPEITVAEIPAEAKSLALIVDDPDAPHGTFDHWVMWNIRPMNRISRDTAPGIQGKNGFGKMAYGGPCPPAGDAHRYFFKVYALDTMLDVPAGADKHTVEKAMKGHIVAQGEIIGKYKRSK